MAGLLLVVFLLLGAAPLPKPQRIMSINMCNDLPLLMLVPKERIASITYLAHDAVKALMPGKDAGIAINHGAAEEILRQKPDLILASPYTSPAARRLAQRVGAPIVEMETANNFEDIRALFRHMGQLVGEPVRAEALIREMDAELARLDAARPQRPLRVVAWSGSGSVPGRGTLTNAIIAAAGAENIAAKNDDGHYSDFGLEELLMQRPDAVMQGIALYDQPSLHRGNARHPLIDRLFAGRQIDYPDAAYTCGLPQSARAASQLRAALGRINDRGRW
ncbi:ABC transporter substrate-binding protein [Sphingomonas bacterium]|uniref:ABC transporter substrate-binding protein n=1 Tax=Sphingomonas bacterium TaxID=1895847 RepID=UPI001575FA50|nr:ABC transporter substrate-binding protein [Sphingomonas bacterium]